MVPGRPPFRAAFAVFTHFATFPSMQILEDGGIRFRYDHVIEEMIRGLGGTTKRQQAPFTPEGGAYEGAGHHYHGHNHEHSLSHE